MKRITIVLAAVLGVACALAVVNCARRGQLAGSEQLADPRGSGDEAGPGAHAHKTGSKGDTMLMEEDDIRIGPGQRFDNLTVFAVFSEHTNSIGAFTTLERALSDGTAEVRELGSEESGSVDAAEVNRLVIDNRGEIALVVLSGTVVTGGKQDRTIAQDFVVAPGKTVDVEAYCVEQNRWEGQRGGIATNGKFKVANTLANASVRNASQFKGGQGKVWGEVDKINKAHRKSTQTGTLAATLQDKELSQRRDALATRASDYLKRQQPGEQLVGLAYAVEGKVRVVRWFMNPELFGLYRDALLRTAALEAMTAQAERKAGKDMPLPKAPGPKDVLAFMSEIRLAAKSAAEERADKNVRRSYEHKSGYGFSLDFEDDAMAAPDAALPAAKVAPRPRPAPVTKGYRAK